MRVGEGREEGIPTLGSGGSSTVAAGSWQGLVGRVSLGEDATLLLRDLRVMLREECALLLSDRRLTKAARLLRVRHVSVSCTPAPLRLQHILTVAP